ncbi:MAG: hypothetical protein AAFX52_14530 [Pseudomonadota bacterium]
MEEKREDLQAEKQTKLLQEVVKELSRLNVDLYYRSTSEIAFLIKDYIKKDARLTQDDRALLEPLSAHDIQLRLSLH